MEEKSRFDRIEEKIDQVLNKKQAKKEFKIPFSARVMGKKGKENYITVMKVNDNGNVSFTKEQIIDQTIMLDNIPRIASGEHVLKYKRNPIIIVPSWSVQPFSPSQSKKESLSDGSNSNGYRLLMNRMQVEAIKLGKKIGGLGIGIGALIIIGVIVYALVTG